MSDQKLKASVFRRTLVSLLLIALLYSGTVFWLHREARQSSEQNLAWLLPALSDALWNLDQKGAQRYIDLLVRNGTCRSVQIRHPDGELFVETTVSHNSLIGNDIPLPGNYQFSRPLQYEGQTIGNIDVEFEPHLLASYLWGALFAILTAALVFFYGRSLLHKRQLKVQDALRREIEERVKTERELIAAKQEAERANRIKSEFLANMSHEIRTPLHVILGYSEILEKQFGKEYKDETAPYFEYIRRASERLLDTIQKIIDISRFHIEGFPFVYQPMELEPIIQNAITSLHILAERKGIFLRFVSHSQGSTWIRGDSYAVHHAISNVIDNAIKYTETGKVSVTLHEEELNAVITVTDTGIGISDDFMSRIFDEFAQESSGYNRPYEGTGLGLSLTRKFVEAGQGSIEVSSQKNKGTTVVLRFPLADRAGATSLDDEARLPEPESTIRSLNLLIVEDDVYTQEFLRTALGNEHDLRFADNGEDAMILLDEHPVDLVLMDMSLKGDMDGLELSSTIRKSRRFSLLPVIALTAHSLEKDREKALAAGCNDYLAKPFRLDDLLQMIARVTRDLS